MLVRLFNFTILSTVVLNEFAIFHNESPFLTVYVLVIPVVVDGIINVCPIDSRFDVRLLASFNSWTFMLYFLAIFHNESPDTIFM